MENKSIAKQAKILLQKYPGIINDGQYQEVGFFLQNIIKQQEDPIDILRRKTKSSVYLCDAIILAADCPASFSLKHDIYPALAEKYNRSIEAIEFSIRNEINYLIGAYSEKKFEGLFGINPKTTKVTAKAFISAVNKKRQEC